MYGGITTCGLTTVAANICTDQFAKGTLYGGFPILGVPSWGPYNEGYNILGSILGCPCFGKVPYTLIIKSL